MQESIHTKEMLFLSEFCGPNKTAWVCQRRETGEYVAVCYAAGVAKLEQSFQTESDAEDFAEDWVLLTTPE